MSFESAPLSQTPKKGFNIHHLFIIIPRKNNYKSECLLYKSARDFSNLCWFETLSASGIVPNKVCDLVAAKSEEKRVLLSEGPLHNYYNRYVKSSLLIDLWISFVVSSSPSDDSPACGR